MIAAIEFPKRILFMSTMFR